MTEEDDEDHEQIVNMLDYQEPRRLSVIYRNEPDQEDEESARMQSQ